MTQAETSDDYVVATGQTESVRSFLEKCFAWMELPLRWEGEGLEEKGFTVIAGREVLAVSVDPKYFRPAEVETLLGDPSNAKNKLGWEPELTVQEMCAEMVSEDLKTAKRHALLKEHGFDLPVSLENG